MRLRSRRAESVRCTTVPDEPEIVMTVRHGDARIKRGGSPEPASTGETDGDREAQEDAQEDDGVGPGPESAVVASTSVGGKVVFVVGPGAVVTAARTAGGAGGAVGAGTKHAVYEIMSFIMVTELDAAVIRSDVAWKIQTAFGSFSPSSVTVPVRSSVTPPAL